MSPGGVAAHAFGAVKPVKGLFKIGDLLSPSLLDGYVGLPVAASARTECDRKSPRQGFNDAVKPLAKGAANLGRLGSAIEAEEQPDLVHHEYSVVLNVL